MFSQYSRNSLYHFDRFWYVVFRVTSKTYHHIDNPPIGWFINASRLEPECMRIYEPKYKQRHHNSKMDACWQTFLVLRCPYHIFSSIEELFNARAYGTKNQLSRAHYLPAELLFEITSVRRSIIAEVDIHSSDIARRVWTFQRPNPRVR